MEESAFEQHARQWRQKAYTVSQRCGASETEAEDIAQDVMLRLWQMREDLVRYEHPEALVTVMAKHMTWSLRRKSQVSPPWERLRVGKFGSGMGAGETSPQELLEEKENEEWLTRRIAQLPPTQRTLLYMRQVERRSHKELSGLLGISEASVSTLLARARRTLLEEIKQRNKQ